MTLAIGVPLGSEWIPAQFWYSFENLIKPVGYKLITMSGALTPVSREKIVEKAIELGCDELLFIDSDMSFRPEAYNQLAARKCDIVSGKFFARYHPYEPCAWKNGKRINLSEFSAVDCSGLAFTLIKMNVFEKMKESGLRPWFNLQIDMSGIDGKYRVDGEDILFHRKANMAGFTSFVDPDVYVGHLTMLAVRQNNDGLLKISKN